MALMAQRPNIEAMSETERAVSPLGIVRLDRDGIIRSFNAAEERFVNRAAVDVIGRSYFRDVAPCTAVREFEGRFIDFVQTNGARCETFGFFYPFASGHKQVTITMIKSAATDPDVYLVTDVGPVTDA
jgi:photoactive yellow protein